MPRLALIVWLLLIGRWTLMPAPGASAAAQLTPWWCISCGEIGTADLFQNLLLFLPVGMLARLMSWGAPRTLLTGFGLSLTIEIFQTAFLPGRDAALGDLLANVAGTAAGWLLLPALRATISPTPGTADRMAASSLAVFFLQLLLSAWLLRPAPGDDTWTIERAPVHHDGTQWPGAVGALTVARVADTVTVATATTWPAQPPARRATVARATRGPLDAVAGVSVASGMLSVGLRTHARAVRLRSPVGQIVLPPLAAGDTLTVRLTHWPGQLTLSGASAWGETRSASVPIGAQHGWVLINPFTAAVELPGSWERWTHAWLAAWGVLLGFGAGASRRWVRWALGGAAVGLGIPWLTGTPLDPAGITVLAAAWTCAALGGRMRRRGHPELE